MRRRSRRGRVVSQSFAPGSKLAKGECDHLARTWVSGATRRAAIALLAAAAGIAVAAPPPACAALTRAQADRTALKLLHPSTAKRVVVFGLRAPVAAASYVIDGGPDAAQPARLVHRNGGTETISSASRGRVARAVWLFWEDLRPYTEFEHPSVLLLLDAATGHVVRRSRYEWWPVLNGTKPPFLLNRGYDAAAFRVFSSAPRPAAAARDASAMPAALSRLRTGPPFARAAAATYPNDCLVEMYDSTDNSFKNDAIALQQFARDSGFLAVAGTRDPVGRAKALDALAAKGCTDAMISSQDMAIRRAPPRPATLRACTAKLRSRGSCNRSPRWGP
jgi:hypothetical protein